MLRYGDPAQVRVPQILVSLSSAVGCECCAGCHSILYRPVVSFLLFCAPYCTAKLAEETATCDNISNGESKKTEGQKK